MATTEKVEQLLAALTAFNKASIKYCLLRNYEFLFNYSLNAESLDASISKESMSKAHEILIFQGFSERKQQFSLCHRSYFKIVELDKISFDIQIGGVYWNDLLYLTEEIFQRRIAKDNVFVLSNNDLVLMLITHSILGKRYFKSKYQRIINNQFCDENDVYVSLAKLFNKSIAARLMQLRRENLLPIINPYYPLIVFLVKKPSRLITIGKLSVRWIRQRKNIFRLAPLVSIVGPDGAGKSSLTNYLYWFLQSKGRKSVVVYAGRGRNHLLPITALGRKYKRAEKHKENSVSNTYYFKKKVIYTISSIIFTLDLFLLYFITILPQRLAGNIVLTDRYCTDIVLMKYVPFSIKRIYLFLFPRPSLSIYLYNNVEILHQRRLEESVEELKRQMEIFEKFSYDLKLETNAQEENQEKIAAFVFRYLLRNWH